MFNSPKPVIATKAIRLTLERIRKKTGKSIKHWFITEKTITEITSRLEEMFDEKGNQTGSKTVKQTITKESN